MVLMRYQIPEVVIVLRRCVGLCVLSLWVALAVACGEKHRETPPPPAFDEGTAAPPPTKRAVRLNPMRELFWGDLHIHSSLSFDAYTFGVKATPDDAYTYAKGGVIEHTVGYPIQLSRPLDFAAVTDHAEFLGLPRHAERDDAVKSNDRLRRALDSHNRLRITWHLARVTLLEMRGNRADREKRFSGLQAAGVSSRAWQQVVTAAQRHNQPQQFTAFVGYEWTSMPGDENLHRNVIYRTAQVPDYPFSALDSDNPMDLWIALEEQRAAGMEMIAIPHNANLSNGRMYAKHDFNGEDITADYAALRMRNEPISEIMQIKGQSETHPVLSSEDEFAAFEIWDETMSAAQLPSQPSGSYARDALRTGLEMRHRAGFNAYQFGFIGSSDGHNASSPVEESRFHGKLPSMDGTPGLRLGTSLLSQAASTVVQKWGAMGLAAVWAQENTRASLFDAMRRRETYATSGPRIKLRFFGGWWFSRAMPAHRHRLPLAYTNGVPMGGVLPPRVRQQRPHFAVWAMKDPEGANLDRIQIIKAWLTADGESREKIFDVAVSDNRRPDPDTGVYPPVGNTVNLSEPSYTNSIGATELSVVWEDTEFNPERETFYYARVLEIPTPRWTAYDAARLGIPPPEPSTLQERAVSSAIWYQVER